MSDETMTTGEVLNADDSAVKTKRKQFSGYKITVPDEITPQVNAAFETLKQRGADVRLDDILREALLRVSQEYLDEQIENLTPPSYYLELAKQDPEVLKVLIKTARTAFENKNRGEAPFKKRGRKAKQESSEVVSSA